MTQLLRRQHQSNVPCCRRKHVHVKKRSQPSGTVSTAVSQRPLTNAAMTFLQHLYVALHNQMWYVILPQYLDSGVMHDVQYTNWGKLSPEHHWRSEWHTYALMFCLENHSYLWYDSASINTMVWACEFQARNSGKNNFVLREPYFEPCGTKPRLASSWNWTTSNMHIHVAKSQAKSWSFSHKNLRW